MGEDALAPVEGGRALGDFPAGGEHQRHVPMFTRLHLTNFKTWKDTGEIALKPVTLLLGTNSSGKSSLIQSLLLLKQTVQTPDRSVHLNLGGDESHDLFDFGAFKDVLRQGVSGPRHFSIAFEFCSRSAQARVRAGEFFCSYGQTSSGAVSIQDWRVQSGSQQFRSVRRGKGAYSVFVGDEQQPRGKDRGLAPERSVALSAEGIALLGLDGSALEDLSLAIRRELENLVYLGPIRRRPERDYIWNRTQPGRVGSDGERAVNILLASALSKDPEESSILPSVSHWLVRMKLADALEVRQLGRSTRYEVVIHSEGVQANLRDVGIGVSQVLPVLTLAYFAPPGSTIVLEEPEIHLHPLAQSVLAELFVEVSQKRQVQFLVETHSEHLFRRMQTLIAKENLEPGDTAMYFVEREENLAKLRELEIDPSGRIRNWPPLFFGDVLGETRLQSELAIRRAKALRAQGGHVSH